MKPDHMKPNHMEPLNQVTVIPMQESKVTVETGHYPPSYCSLTDVWLKTTIGMFTYKNTKEIHKQCGSVHDIWQFHMRPDLKTVHCHKVYDVGHVFTIYYWYGSNYYHMHYDLLIPFFARLYHKHKLLAGKKVVFMPTVETGRLQVSN